MSARVQGKPNADKALLNGSISHAGDETEQGAIRNVLNGDPEAFRVLVQVHQQRLYSLSLMMTRESQAAEEVTQDAFLKAYQHLHRYDTRRPFYPWLAAIAARLAQTWLRRRARQRLTLEPDMDALPPPGRIGADDRPLDLLIADEEGRLLWSKVQALTTGERTVVLSYYKQQLAIKEIAAQLGVTPGTVKTLLFRARSKLRSQLVGQTDIASRESTP